MSTPNSSSGGGASWEGTGFSSFEAWVGYYYEPRIHYLITAKVKFKNQLLTEPTEEVIEASMKCEKAIETLLAKYREFKRLSLKV